ncbi:MAG TPA: hypothetical protein VMR44_10355 [Thermoanaerobaculia bacterium]|nr:hypothetical protein [Thermoanaerobaculia bacterium]
MTRSKAEADRQAAWLAEALEAEPTSPLEALELYSRLPLVPSAERSPAWESRRSYLAEAMGRPPRR